MSYTPLPLDHGLFVITVDLDHYLIHHGKTWILSDTVTVPSMANLDFYFVNGAVGEWHIKEFGFSSKLADASIILYKEPTVTPATGVLQTLQNKHFSFDSATPYGQVYGNPTVTAVGVQKEHFQITGSKQTGGSVAGGGDEWVMPVNTKALLRYTNLANGADTVSYTIKLLDVLYPA